MLELRFHLVSILAAACFAQAALASDSAEQTLGGCSKAIIAVGDLQTYLKTHEVPKILRDSGTVIPILTSSSVLRRVVANFLRRATFEVIPPGTSASDLYISLGTLAKNVWDDRSIGLIQLGHLIFETDRLIKRSRVSSGVEGSGALADEFLTFVFSTESGKYFLSSIQKAAAGVVPPVIREIQIAGSALAPHIPLLPSHERGVILVPQSSPQIVEVQISIPSALRDPKDLSIRFLARAFEVRRELQRLKRLRDQLQSELENYMPDGIPPQTQVSFEETDSGRELSLATESEFFALERRLFEFFDGVYSVSEILIKEWRNPGNSFAELQAVHSLASEGLVSQMAGLDLRAGTSDTHSRSFFDIPARSELFQQAQRNLAQILSVPHVH